MRFEVARLRLRFLDAAGRGLFRNRRLLSRTLLLALPALGGTDVPMRMVAPGMTAGTASEVRVWMTPPSNYWRRLIPAKPILLNRPDDGRH
jgi:hypothetical protein